MFADRAKILIRSGKGGDGHVSLDVYKRQGFILLGMLAVREMEPWKAAKKSCCAIP